MYLTFTSQAHRTGGHSRHKELARALVAAGHDVLWIGPSERDVAGIPGVVHLPLTGRALLLIPLVGRLGAYLLSLARHRRRLDGIRAVLVLRDLELAAARLFPPLRRRPVYLVLRNDQVRKAEARVAGGDSFVGRSANRLRAVFYCKLQRWLYPHATRIIVQTPAIARALQQRLGDGIAPPAVVPNDCRPSWTSAPPVDRRAEWQQHPGQPLVGWVGNLVWEVKGLDLLFEAFTALRQRLDARLVVIGGGRDRGRLEKAARRLPCGAAVHLVGPVSNAFQLMSGLDVLLVPSRYDDCPNVVLEAMAAGLPVVASDIEAHAFLLGPGGALTPVGDASAMAGRAFSLLTDRAERDRVLAAQEMRRQRFEFAWGERMVRLLE